MLSRTEIDRKLEEIILDLMAATTKPATKAGHTEMMDKVLSAYHNAREVKEGLKEDS